MTDVTGKPIEGMTKPRLLQLPSELRSRILQYLLHSTEPLGRRYDPYEPMRYSPFTYQGPPETNFSLHPAVLRVCSVLADEGYDILYHQNIATGLIHIHPDEKHSAVEFLGNLVGKSESGCNIARRFTNWDVIVNVHGAMPDNAIKVVINFTSVILRNIRDVKSLTVHVYRWDSMSCMNLDLSLKADLDDVAEQVLRPFSAIRAKKVAFVDEAGHPIKSVTALAGLMESDEACPKHTIQELYNDLISFLNCSLTETSQTIMERRLSILKICCDTWDTEAFQFCLQSVLKSLSTVRGITPPQHITDFVSRKLPASTTASRLEVDWPVT